MDISVSSLSEQSTSREPVLPPLADLQSVLRRVQSDGAITQAGVFNALAPLLVFLALLILGIIALQPGSSAQRVLKAPNEHMHDILKGISVIFGGLIVGAGMFRALIWGIALGVEAILNSDVKRASDTQRCLTPKEQAVPNTTSALLSGIFH
ncbi:hypothetical protein PHLCEN_2v11678 [Hermanssonia centrifuga]|uniref:Uncharacterized protein n=1 Tax=Hermanssonia centrifuga TaxID=98765 RepID=A0A2R6NJD3_9APHY|nr:hypothetical protein PHLCEN_2v11678 [Hermanssonia centrifuga]